MKRLYLLGSRGMLGQMVQRYFNSSNAFQVSSIDDRFNDENLINFFRKFDNDEPAVFINCIGAIPQKILKADEFSLPNILLPLEICRTLAPHHRLIHPSTDCVFSGSASSPYSKDAFPDASDTYGWSKLQAERLLMTRPNTTVIRTSIIGPSDRGNAGLLQWFLSQPKGSRLFGYTNHYWNGMTTLQWCREVEKILLTTSNSIDELIQFSWLDGCSKYEMLLQFKEVFRQDIEIVPTEHQNTIDRRLQPDIIVPRLNDQLNDLRHKIGNLLD